VARAIKAQLYEPLGALHRRLLGWFKTHQRRFPWRDSLDPFQILIAEKLLQQTAATASVVAAYRELLARYPDCDALARAPVTAVRQIIKPLGLHYRAGELVRLAKAIRRRHDGQVPRDLGDLLSLPGVGDYAARAVQAFAFGRAVGVVDSNVARFLGRYFGLSTPKTENPARNRSLLAIAGALVPASGAREFNLAILDLCAAHCTAIGPACEQCPLAAKCAHARKSGTQEPLTGLAKSVRFAGRPTAA
jgi:A/G-specific adenine glycosylase